MTLIVSVVHSGRLLLLPSLEISFKDKFWTSKNRANTCGRFELMGVAMGFGKGETSLVRNLIRMIDIALRDKEGCLSRNKLATIRHILEGCYKEREDSRDNDSDKKAGGGKGSGSSSDDVYPNGGSIPL